MNGKNRPPQGNGKPASRKPSGGAKPQGRGDAHSRAPESTHEEVRYLKYLIENEIPVRVKLRDNQEVSGTIEYYDHSFIRLTREGEPNLFIYKHEIKYLYEE